LAKFLAIKPGVWMRPFLKITPEGLTKVSIPKQYMGRQKKLKCMFFKIFTSHIFNSTN